MKTLTTKLTKTIHLSLLGLSLCGFPQVSWGQNDCRLFVADWGAIQEGSAEHKEARRILTRKGFELDESLSPWMRAGAAELKPGFAYGKLPGGQKTELLRTKSSSLVVHPAQGRARVMVVKNKPSFFLEIATSFPSELSQQENKLAQEEFQLRHTQHLVFGSIEDCRLDKGQAQGTLKCPAFPLMVGPLVSAQVRGPASEDSRQIQGKSKSVLEFLRKLPRCSLEDLAQN